MGTEAAASAPGIEISREFELKKIPVPPSPACPVIFTIGGSVEISGVAEPAGSESKVAYSRGEAGKQALGVELENRFCNVTVKLEFEDGHFSGFTIGFGKEKEIPVKIELTLFAHHYPTVTVKPSKPIPLAEIELRLGPGEPYKFKGELTPELVVEMEVNTLWPGWKNVGRLAARNARTLVQPGVSAVRAVYFAGEAGMVSTTGVVAVATIAAGLSLAWVGFGLYSMGENLRGGRMVAVGRYFSDGYARLLAQMTEQPPAASESEVKKLLAMTKWNADFTRLSQEYANGGSDAVCLRIKSQVENLGAAAIVQDIDKLIKTPGSPPWSQVSIKHRTKYGGDVERRRRSYIEILDHQVVTKAPVLGVQLL